MKNAIIFHGISSNPQQFWFPYLKLELEKKGYDVWVPQLPETDNPKLEIQLPWVLQHGKFTKDTILIGHSSGVPLILAVLEKIETPIQKALLVAGFFTKTASKPRGILKDTYNWQKIKKRAQDFIFINAVNDPWECNDIEGRNMFNHLGGTLIINNEGHMGSDMYYQPYKEFPLLVKLIEVSENNNNI